MIIEAFVKRTKWHKEHEPEARKLYIAPHI